MPDNLVHGSDSPSRRSARSRSGSVTDPTVEAWTRENARVHGRACASRRGRPRRSHGASSTSRSRELHALCRTWPARRSSKLGCGTAYFGAWLKKAGAARVVGVDPTPAQLATARRCEERFGLGLEFVEAFGEDVPLPDASLRPRRLGVRRLDLGRPVPLDPGGGSAATPGRRASVFLRNSTLVILVLARRGRRGGGDAAASAVRDAPLPWPDQGVEYHLPHGDGSGFCARTASRSST